jgi:hypothetical protein
VVWLWVLAGSAVWLVLGVLVALTVGRSVRIADEQSPHVGLPAGFSTADLPAALKAPSRVAAAPRPVPLPPVGVGLILVALGLETAGYVTRLTGKRGALATALSMDAPFSVPRLFVAGLFVVAALAAVAGAGVHPGRRAWWLAVAVVAAGIASVKAGSTVHARLLGAAADLVGSTAALVVSGLLAAGVVGVLWYLSRDERRDRRRVLSALSLYGVAVVGLSALSSAVTGSYGAGSSWAAAATFVEESGEALAGVGYLVAVLVGVAPRLVLPAAWPLRRRADAEALAEVPGPAAAGLRGQVSDQV